MKFNHRWIVLSLAASLSFVVSASSFAAGEGDIFATLLSRLGGPGEGRVFSYVLENTDEGTAITRAILGDAAAGAEASKAPELAIQRLREQGQTQLAEALEERLNEIDQSFDRAMDANPNEDMDNLLKRLASEKLRIQVVDGAQAGQEIRFVTERAGEEGVAAEFMNANPEADFAKLETKVNEAAQAKPAAKIAETLALYRRLAEDPAFAQALPKRLVLEQLGDQEMTEFTGRLRQILEHVEHAPAHEGSIEKLKGAIRAVLKENVPEGTIESRIEDLLAGKQGAFRRVLGDMTLDELQKFVHGGDPLHPTPDSLIGKYMQESGAKSVIRKFSLGPDKPGQEGPERLVVAVSPESFPTFMKYFKRNELISVFGHNYVTQDGKVFSYMHTGEEFRAPHQGTPLPTVLLKPTEAQRTAQYFELLNRHREWGDIGMSPWALDGYCARTAYLNCTQWIGNMPIGDERVMEYAFPGKVDYAGTALYNDPARDALPRIARLKPYANNDPLVRRVWKVPGNMQFADLIGQRDANLRGDFTNPGWVITTLLGPTSVDRVPVVFLMTADQRADIPADFVPQFEPPR